MKNTARRHYGVDPLRMRLGWDRIAQQKDKAAGYTNLDDPDSNQLKFVKLLCDQALFLKRFDTTLNATLKDIGLPYTVQALDGALEIPRTSFGDDGPPIDITRKAIENKGLNDADYIREVWKRNNPFWSDSVMERNDNKRNLHARLINDFFGYSVLENRNDQWLLSDSTLEHIAYTRQHALLWDHELERNECTCKR